MPCMLDDVIVTNVLESMPLGLMVIRPDGKISLVNEALTRILGHSRTEMLEKGWGEIFYDDQDNDAFNQTLIDVIVDKHLKHRREAPYVKPSGDLAQLAVTSSYLRGDQGELAGIVVLMEDVTEKHLLHQREKASLEEKNRLDQERARSLNLFAMSVAHQIRNPLMTIGGFGNLLAKKAGGKERDYLEVIIEQASRMERIVQSVSDFTSVPRPRCRRESLEPVWKACREALDRLAASRGRGIVWEFEMMGREAFFDPDLLKRVLDAGLINALEFSEARNLSIRVRAGDDGSRFHLEVEDDGPGIAAENLPYVFDPFFTTKADGIGMGLTLAKRIVEEHRGCIHVGCPFDRGTRLEIELPMQG